MDNNSDKNVGQKIYELCDSIFPICRSLTGEGVRKTISILNQYIEDTGVQFDVHEVPSGTQAFDWTVPDEWVIRDAYIEDESGNRIIDFRKNNLHVMGYSTAVDTWCDLDELLTHIYTEPDQPEVIPYVTSYYSERYGFCMSENMKNSLTSGRYHMYIDSEHKKGSLTYADLVIKGEEEKEILITSYVCHPSMADNECSGPSLLAELVRYVISMKKRRYSYRFVLEPESLGAITYISQHLEVLKANVFAAFNLTCVGDNYAYSVVETPDADSISDRVIKNALIGRENTKFYSFLVRGSDERQYNAPGVDIPMISFCRSKFGTFPEYHTSDDNMSFVSPEGFMGSYEVMTKTILALENNYRFRTTVLCEPQLSKRGLSKAISQKSNYGNEMYFRHFLAFSNGKNDLIDIGNKINVPAADLLPYAERLAEEGLVERI
ncbi:DUF4910 domain-containing protein [Butyrivibrio sp. CB08]|uniref:DUF4910 domain-containing protein n=1 Tax=Butyrivibrio sp. CB08 TaxID=2364879 RepID=UPI000EAA8632|nr:DUF4910 domain-containing protein [Butyrivibrio sp. CB08]RKM59830.1 DUF4910 domain-containing protein [Butyrivibrio sp. CB08]